jgi:hypothetical protein
MRGLTWCFTFGLGLGLAMFAPGCGDGGADDCSPGAPGCVCVVGDLCATGLSCVSGYCVNLGGSGTNTNGSSADGDGDAGDGDPGDGDPGGSENLCQELIDCVKAAQPEALSAYVTLYGPEGECYEIAGLTEQDCWAECDAIRETLALTFPDVTACGPINCGDGKLDKEEMCDGGSGCTATCSYDPDLYPDNECSPITQVGCNPVNERCAISTGEWENQFGCLSNSPNSTPAEQVNETCHYDSDCSYAPNAICMDRPDCVEWACCTDLCYLGATDLDVVDCPPGFGCISVEDLYVNPFPSGSELVGVCWPS